MIMYSLCLVFNLYILLGYVELKLCFTWYINQSTSREIAPVLFCSYLWCWRLGRSPHVCLGGLCHSSLLYMSSHFYSMSWSHVVQLLFSRWNNNHGEMGDPCHYEKKNYWNVVWNLVLSWKMFICYLVFVNGLSLLFCFCMYHCISFGDSPIAGLVPNADWSLNHFLVWKWVSASEF